MPRLVGVGLVALDVVVDDRTGHRLTAAAGGSCGNVSAILAWLGWDVAVVARLGNEPNASFIRRELVECGVDDRWMRLAPSAAAPVFLERLRHDDHGRTHHTFARVCESCGGRLPGYQPVPRASLDPVLSDLPNWDFLYADRPSAGAVRLAREAAESQLFVFFEPSSRGALPHMRDIAASADVVKYSSDRLNGDDREAIAAARPPLEIETLGSDGLRYRVDGADWITIGAPTVPAWDTAGAGDWTTAGFLYRLAQAQCPSMRFDDSHLRDLLQFAQAFGAWSCQFAGARGAMRNVGPREALAAVDGLLRGDFETARSSFQPTPAQPRWVCSSCP